MRTAEYAGCEIVNAYLSARLFLSEHLIGILACVSVVLLVIIAGLLDARRR